MIVLKFGGSALCDASSFLLCAKKIASLNPPYAITVSAMQGVTQILLEIATQRSQSQLELLVLRHEMLIKVLAEHHQPFGLFASEILDLIYQKSSHIKEMIAGQQLEQQQIAEILSQGEWLSAHILIKLLCSLQQDVSLLDPRQLIRTQGASLNSQVLLQETINKIIPLREHPHSRFLMPGFFGGNHASGQTTLLGMNSSDYSGALLAVGLGAFGYEIWKDIDGIYEADPKLERHASIKKYLSYQELIEKSEHYSQVIHPAVAPLLQEAGIPIFIKNIFQPDKPGSVITDSQLSFSHKAN